MVLPLSMMGIYIRMKSNSKSMKRVCLKWCAGVSMREIYSCECSKEMANKLEVYCVNERGFNWHGHIGLGKIWIVLRVTSLWASIKRCLGVGG